ncbi:MAG: DsbA family protein [Candidatus Woesearchaeota archaeon]
MDEHKHKIEEHKLAEHKHKKVHIKKSTMWMATSGVLAVLLVISIFTHGFRFEPKPTDIKTPTASSGETVKLDFYVMSQCPFGTQVVDAVKPTLDQLGSNVEFNLNFIATDKGDGTFSSMHGDNEVKGDIVQLCAAKHEPQKYMDMIVCQNKDAQQVATNWEQCAKDAGMAVDKIKTCFEGAEGKQLLTASIQNTNKVGATGSPTIYVNDKPYSGGRQGNDFLRALCNEFATKPAACSNIPAPVKVNAIILNDKRCKDCDTTGLVAQLKSLFPGLQVQEMDYADAQGKKLYGDLKLQLLPAILFDSTVQKGEGYATVQSYLETVGDYQNLRIGSSFDPKAEICDNGIDDDGNGQIDCKDTGCKGNMLCRANAPKKLDLFVMSQCPYGLQAMDAMKEVLTAFKGNMDFSLHYIADLQADGTFSSLHGQGEVDEDLREVCAIKYYPKDYKYMDYIWCRNKDIKNVDWQSCATSAGMSPSQIKTCAEGAEGKTLLTENLKLTNELQIGASPTWMANNKVQFSGIDAETVKTNYCQANPGLAGCEQTLTGTSATAAAGNCGG